VLQGIVGLMANGYKRPRQGGGADSRWLGSMATLHARHFSPYDGLTC
jgi:hypothetical protein